MSCPPIIFWLMNTNLSLIRANIATLTAFIFVTIICNQRLTGFIILPIALLALLYQSIQFLRCWRSAEQRAIRLTAMAIIMISVFVVLAINIYRDYTSRASNDLIVEAIERFQLKNDRYPMPTEVGFDASIVHHITGTYYVVDSGHPSLVYDATF